jgi:hypothetical protein
VYLPWSSTIAMSSPWRWALAKSGSKSILILGWK